MGDKDARIDAIPQGKLPPGEYEIDREILERWDGVPPLTRKPLSKKDLNWEPGKPSKRYTAPEQKQFRAQSIAAASRVFGPSLGSDYDDFDIPAVARGIIELADHLYNYIELGETP